MKSFLVFGSLHFLGAAVALAIVLGLLVPRLKRLALMGLVCLLAIYLGLATPFTAHRLASGFRLIPYVGPPDWTHLVLIEGDNQDGRIATTAQAFEKHPSAQVIVIGREQVVDELRQVGVRSEAISSYDEGGTTRSQLDRLAAALPRSTPVAVVVSRLQSPRVGRLATARGLSRLVMLPSPVGFEERPAGMWQFLPSLRALFVSRDALYEHVALVYYEWRGWV